MHCGPFFQGIKNVFQDSNVLKEKTILLLVNNKMSSTQSKQAVYCIFSIDKDADIKNKIFLHTKSEASEEI